VAVGPVGVIDPRADRAGLDRFASLHGGTAILIILGCWRIATRKARAVAAVAVLVMAPFTYWSIDNWYVVTGQSRLFTSKWIQEPFTSRDISI
jgi:hypothetical protein